MLKAIITHKTDAVSSYVSEIIDSEMRTQILSDLPQTAKNIFLLCNFVYHRNVSENHEDFESKVTSSNVICALIGIIIEKYGKDICIAVGNSPLQSANWEKICIDTKIKEVVERINKRLGKKIVTLVDLRDTVLINKFNSALHVKTKNPLDTVMFNLESESYLSKFDTPNLFRVTDYDANKTKKFHDKKQHSYCVSRQIINSDIIIHLPKVKTHEKVGLTLGVKGCVGAVTNKVCLAHHRKGPPPSGDEFEKESILLNLSSWLNDFQFHYNNQFFRKVIYYLLRSVWFICRKKNYRLGGSWQGNDTAWRMAFDLFHILQFGNNNGKIEKEIQRANYVLYDAINAGEGQGPLKPTAKKLNMVLWSNNLYFGDYLVGNLLGCKIDKIPIIKSCLDKIKNSLMTECYSIKYNTKNKKVSELKGVLDQVKPPKSWTIY